MVLEVNKSETLSPNLATGYNRFTQCKPWPILLIIVSSNFVLKLKDRIGQTIKQGCFYDVLARGKKTPRHFVEDRFFSPCGVTSLATHVTSTYYSFFWVNLFKAQNKLIFHSTTWIGLTWPARFLLQEADSWFNFLFINWDHNP